MDFVLLNNFVLEGELSIFFSSSPRYHWLDFSNLPFAALEATFFQLVKTVVSTKDISKKHLKKLLTFHIVLSYYR